MAHLQQHTTQYSTHSSTPQYTIPPHTSSHLLTPTSPAHMEHEHHQHTLNHRTNRCNHITNRQNNVLNKISFHLASNWLGLKTPTWLYASTVHIRSGLGTVHCGRVCANTNAKSSLQPVWKLSVHTNHKLTNLTLYTCMEEGVKGTHSIGRNSTHDLTRACNRRHTCTLEIQRHCSGPRISIFCTRITFRNHWVILYHQHYLSHCFPTMTYFANC